MLFVSRYRVSLLFRLFCVHLMHTFSQLHQISNFQYTLSMVNVASGGQSSTAAMGAGVTEDQFSKH